MNTASEEFKEAVAIIAELRHASAACFQVIHKRPYMINELGDELKHAGVKDGFGKRAEDFLKRHASQTR